MIDITEGYVAQVVAAVATINEEVDLKVRQEDQKDRFLQRLNFKVGRLEAEVAIIVIAAKFVCVVRRSWEWRCHRRYHQ